MKKDCALNAGNEELFQGTKNVSDAFQSIIDVVVQRGFVVDVTLILSTKIEAYLYAMIVSIITRDIKSIKNPTFNQIKNYADRL